MKTSSLLYFVAILTTLTAIAVLACNVFPNYFTKTEQFAKWGLGGVLAEIIGLFVLLTKNSTKEKRIIVNLSFSEDYKATYTVNKIIWNPDLCFAKAGAMKEKIQLIRSQEIQILIGDNFLLLKKSHPLIKGNYKTY